MKRSSPQSRHVRITIFVLSVLLWHDKSSSTTCINALLVAPSATAKQWVTTSPPLLSSSSSSASPATASAFVIERLSDHAPPHVFSKIAKLCINVFFNQGRGPGDYVPPWQQAQLTYLQHMQAADLQQRRYSQQQLYPYSMYQGGSGNDNCNNYNNDDEQFQVFYDDTNPEISYSRRRLSSSSQQQKTVEYNDMFVAYQVIRAEPQVARRKPLLLDLSNVYNAPSNQQQPEPSPWQVYHDDDDVEYVRGELLGFCEVTERYFGLDNGNQRRHHMYQPQQQQPQQSIPSPLCAAQVRPILTNLAVKPKARQLGIGSALVQACEEAVMERGRFHEVVLEVEAENSKALAFYQKRGYQVLYQDPACRRYDVEGFMLRKLPCTRIVMRKCLYPYDDNDTFAEGYNQQSNRSSSAATENSSSSSRMTSSLVSMWQRLRQKSLGYIHV